MSREEQIEKALRSFLESHKIPLNVSDTIRYRPCTTLSSCNHCREAEQALRAPKAK